MKKLRFTIIFAILFVLFSNINHFGKNPQTISKATISIKAEINPGMELLAIMLWLSGSYPQPADSKYKSEVWNYFAKFRKHPEILKMKKLTFYPDFTENGLLLSDFPKVKTEIPESNVWFKILGSKENFVLVLNGAEVFARDTNFWKFYQKQQPNYSAWTDKFAKELKEKEVIQSVDSFFRYRDERQFPNITIYLEPLNGWGAHAINFERLSGKPNNGRVSFQIGPASGDEQFIDSPLVFKCSGNTIQTIWHESNHIYLSKILTNYDEKIHKLTRLFNASDLASQNIKTWRYAFEENLVRAITAAITRKKFGEVAYKQEVTTQTQRGFIYTAEIAELISAKYNPTNYANFDEFMPEILSLLESKQSVANAKN